MAGVSRSVDGIVETRQLSAKGGDGLAWTGWARRHQKEAADVQLLKAAPKAGPVGGGGMVAVKPGQGPHITEGERPPEAEKDSERIFSQGLRGMGPRRHPDRAPLGMRGVRSRRTPGARAAGTCGPSSRPQ